MNAENKKVLKNHDLSGLSEIELQVLLLQNDAFFLPDVSCTGFLGESYGLLGIGQGKRECGVLSLMSSC